MGPFSNVDLRKLGRNKMLEFVMPIKTHYRVAPIANAATCQHNLDSAVARCQICFCDVKALTLMLRHFYFDNGILKDAILQNLQRNPEQSMATFTVGLSEWKLLSAVGLTGLPNTILEIFDAKIIQKMIIHVNEKDEQPACYIEISFDSAGRISKHQVVGAIVEQPGESKIRKAASNESQKARSKNKPKPASDIKPVATSSSLSIEAGFAHDGKILVAVSVEGQQILRTYLSNSKFSGSITLQFFTSEQQDCIIPIFTTCLGSIESFSEFKVARPGMRLEAVDLIYPHLIAAAHIGEISADGKWLIKFDNWESKYDYWAEPTASHLFPCGFMEYIDRNPDCGTQLKADRKQSQLKLQLQRPKNSSYSQSPFPWDVYFVALRSAPHANEKDENATAVPINLFEPSHLLGFNQDPHCRKYEADCFHSQSLMSYCSELFAANLTQLHDIQLKIVRLGLMLPLPYMDWQSVMWPTRNRYVNPNTFAYFFCPWFEYPHFVNAPKLTSSPLSLNASKPGLVNALIKMLLQPHFLPDKCDKLFDGLVDNPFPPSWPNFAAKSGAAKLEHYFRKRVLPFLIDYLLMANVFLSYIKADDTKTLNALADKAMNDFSANLRLDDAVQSKWSVVMVTPEQPTPKSYLLNLKEAEGDFYLKNELCPPLLCGQHAYHFTTFEKATGKKEVRVDWDSSLSNVGHFHDEFLTVLAMATDDLTELHKRIDFSHPHLMSFIGFMPYEAIERSGLSDLKYLNELYLPNNDLRSLPAALSNLAPSLQRLDLSQNRFENVPKVIFKLKALVYLRLDKMNLQSVDEEIGELSGLTFLSIKQNCFRALPDGFKKLTNLEILDLSGAPSISLSNASSSIHVEEIGAYMENNRFPEAAIDLLVKHSEELKITTLDRPNVDRFNKVLFDVIPRLNTIEGTFPLDITDFPKLETLILANQGIVTVPETIEKMKALKRLDLSGCVALTSIAHQITKCPIDRLVLENCPELKTPPAEVRKKGLSDIMGFFVRLSQGSIQCKRTKLMFVGLGGAGKTTLVHALLQDQGQNSAVYEVTDGIDIVRWKHKDIEFRMWDFAGQVVYYNTHQFFISNRAVYILLWNMRLGHEHAGLDFWLSSIACHAPKAPILIVGTHVDKIAQERAFLPETAYRTRFESIAGFHYVSSHTKKGIDELREDIVRITLKQKYIGESVPVAWLTLEDLFEQLCDSGQRQSVLPLETVHEIAKECNITNPEEIDQALQFLTDMGSIQYFQTDFLRDRVIIDPQWIVDVMAKVVSVKNTKYIQGGKLKHSDINRLWLSYTPRIHSWLLKLTEAFDLTFPLKHESASIVPCLLPEDPPETMKFPSLDDNPSHHQTRLLFAFKYLPTGLFNRIQVRLCQFADDHTMWRRGSLLRKNQHLALLSQPDATSIQVKVQGPCPENIAFLILEVVDTLIVDSFQGVQPDYLFACPACVSSRSPDPSMFERSRIRRAFELRIPFLQCWNYFHSVSTQELRQLFPAESSSEFETQFYRTMQELNSIQQKLKLDILVIGCSADSNPNDMANSVSTEEVGADIEKAFPNLRVVTVPNPDSETDAVSYDHLAVMMRKARIIVFCLSEMFMQSDRCQAAFFTGRETLRKQVLIVVIREFDMVKYSALAFQMTDDIYVKAINRNRYQPAVVAQRLTMRFEQSSKVQAVESQKKKTPDVFISYCWQNSQDAVMKGSKSEPKALGVTDPREIKRFLSDNGFECWLDIEQIGLGGLFRDIADGIRNAQVVVVCVSDEYAKSENCLREFHFATTSLRRPVVLCPVGTGVDWQTSEVNLIVCQSATTINFQVNVPENYDSLLKAVKSHVKDRNAVDNTESQGLTMLSKLGRRKTQTNINQGEKHENDEQRALVLQEVIELGQRKMLRQLTGYAKSADSKPYPRIILLDADTAPEQQQVSADRPCVSADVEEAKQPGEGEGDDYREGEIIEEEIEEDRNRDSNDPFYKLKWQIKFLCEHDAGWHPTNKGIYLTKDRDPSQLFSQSSGYFAPLLQFMKQSGNTSLDLFAPKQESLAQYCAEIVGLIDQMIDPEQLTFESHYVFFRSLVMAIDRQSECGGLRKCMLALGKELWLCSEHQGVYRSRIVAEAKTETKEDGETAAGSVSAENIITEQRTKLKAIVRPKLEDSKKFSRACNLQ